MLFILGVIFAPLGLLGNRIIFLTLLIVAFIAWLLQRQLGESQRWEEEKRKEKQGTKVAASPYKTLFSNMTSFKVLIFLVGVYLFWNLVAGEMFPTILSGLGFKVAGTFMIVFLVLSLLIGLIWTPRTRGKSLEQIESTLSVK
ncbi:MFS transporter [Alicyclobacillus fastidiosus]|uniref:MFS transporter n=1 Tax=Alicyclobacillus fastidiosus TaxID=392011 RepID=A0ABV5AIT9_9BACL|nr:MFS transporter [Alicyclobacillus fastidiosus]WEH07795.1 MFS transporter [Alicyclobacillus fastidiosus]